MPNLLKNMRVKEISLVDEPASPGANIIFSKRADGAAPMSDIDSVTFFKNLCQDGLFTKGIKGAPSLAHANPSNRVLDAGGKGVTRRKRHGIAGRALLFAKYDDSEPRDEHGRWTTGGVSAAIASKLRQLKTHAANLGAKVVGAVRGGKVTGVNPVENGGVQFAFEHTIPGHGTLRSTVQIHPKHMRNSKTMENALAIAHRALGAYGRPPVPVVNEVAGGIHVKGSYQSGTLGGIAYPQSGNGAGGSWVRDRSVVTPGSTPAQNLIPTQTGDQLRAQQGLMSPDNNLPINVIRGQMEGGMQQPLNHPSIDFNNSNGHAYLTPNGEFVPGGTTEEQKEVDTVYNTPGAHDALKQATAQTSGGAAYKTQLGDVVPSGNPGRQANLESRHNAWNGFVDSQSARNLPAPYVRASFVSKSVLFAETPRLFKPSRTVLFGKHGNANVQLFNQAHRDRSLFGKAVTDEARDSLGRWVASGASAATASVAGRIKSLVAGLKQPGNAAGIAASGVAGALGLPDDLATHVSHAVSHATDVAIQRIKSDPRFMQFASGVRSSAVAAARKLFSKSYGTLSPDEHAELKGHISRILSRMPLHSTIADDHAALSAVCQGVHDHLCRTLT